MENEVNIFLVQAHLKALRIWYPQCFNRFTCADNNNEMCSLFSLSTV